MPSHSSVAAGVQPRCLSASQCEALAHDDSMAGKPWSTVNWHPLVHSRCFRRLFFLDLGICPIRQGCKSTLAGRQVRPLVEIGQSPAERERGTVFPRATFAPASLTGRCRARHGAFARGAARMGEYRSERPAARWPWLYASKAWPTTSGSTLARHWTIAAR
jgi:hypothetical protein